MISRRTALAALGAAPLGALAAGAALRGGASAAASPPAGAATPAPLDAYVRLHWAPGGAWVLWLYAGVLVVKPEGEVARPLVRIRGLSFSRAVPQADGSIVAELDEAGWYCDLVSGQPLATLRNPFTDRDVAVKHYRSPQRLRLAGSAYSPGQELPPGIEFRGERLVLADVGGSVSMTEDLYVKMPAVAATDGPPPRPARPARFSASLATFTAPAAQLADPKANWIASTLSYGTMNSFAGWLGMDDVPGVQNMRLAGAKRRPTELDAVDPDVMSWVRREQASILEVPKRA